VREIGSRRRARRGALALHAVSLALLAVEARAQPFSVRGPGVNAAAFEVTIFASGLAFPSSMQQLADGSLIVLTTAPNGLWGQSDGRILRLVDTDGNGVADGPPQELASGLPGVATSLRIAGELVFVSAQERGSEGIHVLRTGATPDVP